MFGKTAPQTESAPRPERSEQSFLQNGVRVHGDMEVDGDLRIEGSMQGTLNTRGVLMIGPKAFVDGEIRGREVVVHGRVSGTVHAEERIQLARGAKVQGDLHCKSLVVEEGVFFEGRSHMGEGPAPKGEARSAAAGAMGSSGSSGAAGSSGTVGRGGATGSPSKPGSGPGQDPRYPASASDPAGKRMAVGSEGGAKQSGPRR